VMPPHAQESFECAQCRSVAFKQEDAQGTGGFYQRHRAANSITSCTLPAVWHQKCSVNRLMKGGQALKKSDAWIRKVIFGAFIVGLSLGLNGCQNEAADASSLNYRSFLSITQVKSSYHSEPKTGEKYPLVQGTLANLGSKTLEVVELTLRFKNGIQEVIYEDHAYPVYVSEFAQPEANEILKPGAKTRFAFKAPKCPPGWQVGSVDIEITKVVFTK
jgi:hypothetical protein